MSDSLVAQVEALPRIADSIAPRRRDLRRSPLSSLAIAERNAAGPTLAMRSARAAALICGGWWLVWMPCATAKDVVPDSAAQILATGKVERDYELDHSRELSAAEKFGLASKMFAAAGKAKEPAHRFVLLRMARDYAAEAGNLELALRAVDEFGKKFEVDIAGMRGAAIAVAVSHIRNVTDSRQFVELAERAADEALGAKNFELAQRLAEAACIAAKDTKLLSGAIRRRDQLAELIDASKASQGPNSVMEDDPANPEANLVAGRYSCFFKDDWDTGLMMLALGSDAKLAELAVAELRLPNDASEQIRIADDWWSLSVRHQGIAQARIQRHAAEWYRKASPHLTGSPSQEIVARMAQAADLNCIGSTSAESTAKPPAGKSKPASRASESARSNAALAPVQASLVGGPVIPSVALVTKHVVNGHLNGTVVLYSNGHIGKPDSASTWSFDGKTLVYRWPTRGAPGGAWLDRMTLSPNGKAFDGRNQLGATIHDEIQSGSVSALNFGRR